MNVMWSLEAKIITSEQNIKLLLNVFLEQSLKHVNFVRTFDVVIAGNIHSFFFDRGRDC